MIFCVCFQGAGTRDGKGTCSCHTGYRGDLCDACTDGHFEEVKNETHTVCKGGSKILYAKVGQNHICTQYLPKYFWFPLVELSKIKAPKLVPVWQVDYQCMPIIFMSHRSFSVILLSHIGNFSQVWVNLHRSWPTDQCNWHRLDYLLV